MTDFHRTPEWMRFLRKVRPIIKASLPRPCVNRCQYDGIVHEGQRFDVSHLPGREGSMQLEDVGPAHPRCNRSDGGKVGRQKQLARARRAPGPTW